MLLLIFGNCEQWLNDKTDFLTDYYPCDTSLMLEENFKLSSTGILEKF
jgi:hypothetical protein